MGSDGEWWGVMGSDGEWWGVMGSDGEWWGVMAVSQSDIYEILCGSIIAIKNRFLWKWFLFQENHVLTTENDFWQEKMMFWKQKMISGWRKWCSENRKWCSKNRKWFLVAENDLPRIENDFLLINLMFIYRSLELLHTHMACRELRSDIIKKEWTLMIAGLNVCQLILGFLPLMTPWQLCSLLWSNNWFFVVYPKHMFHDHWVAYSCISMTWPRSYSWYWVCFSFNLAPRIIPQWIFVV
jgi:hypothetical protein